MQPTRPRRPIVDVVLGAQGPARHHPAVTGPAVALVAGVLCVFWLPNVERVVAPAPAKSSRTREPLTIELAPPIEPSPAPLPPQPQTAAARLPAPRSSTRAATPAAQAAAVVAQEPGPSEPVDLTADVIVTGTARTYAGGVTTATGTATKAADGANTGEPRAPATGSGSLDRSAPVALADQSWSCPWPAEADALQIDEQTVVIRVVVRSDGTAESVAVVHDPGNGFGAAASRCALGTRFAPARARNGDALRATSPPIRVRFTR